MSALSESLVLGRRAINETLRTPEAIIPTVFIPLFFLVVNIGQAAKTFPKGTPFLEGQNYGAFQLPSSLLLAASFGSAALFLVEDIEGGYFDKLRASPVSRTALVMGRLTADALKGVVITAVIVVLAGLNSGDYLRFPPEGLSLRWVRSFLTSDTFLPAYLFSLRLAFVTMVAATVLGTMTAIFLTRVRFRGRGFVRAFFLAPLLLPGVVLGLALYIYYLGLPLGMGRAGCATRST